VKGVNEQGFLYYFAIILGKGVGKFINPHTFHHEVLRTGFVHHGEGCGSKVIKLENPRV